MEDDSAERGSSLQTSAFVGVSLDSKDFSRAWVRYALHYILARHKDVQLVLGDRLLTYNKVLDRTDGKIVLNLSACSSRIEKRKSDIFTFLLSEVSRLPECDQERVQIANWDDYSDAHHINILRALTIAYYSISEFRKCVETDVDTHLMAKLACHTEVKIDRSLCACYVLEETAMIIRITEIAARPFEYYPQQHINTLQQLYSDHFTKFGLSVECLIGRGKSRVFTPLPLSE